MNNRHHHLALGGLEMLGMFIVIGFSSWFFYAYVGFINKNYNPNGDEKKIGIKYDLDGIAVPFIVFLAISFIVYLVGSALFFADKGVMTGGNINYKYTLLATSIITALMGLGMIIDSGLGFASYKKLTENYSTNEQQNARNTLRSNGVPYLDISIAALITGILQILLMVALVTYYFTHIKEEEEASILSPEPAPPPVKKNYLANDTRNL
jgi:small-conductance mechanosensitive channel